MLDMYICVHNTFIKMVKLLSTRGDNPLVLASGLSLVHVDNHVRHVHLCT